MGIAQKRTVEVDVLTCGQLEIETCAKLDEGGDVSANNNLALGGLQNASDDFKHGGFTGAVGAHKTHDLALGHIK